MPIILKTRGNQLISDRDKRWAEAKFRKIERFVPQAAVVEVTLEDLYGPKRGRDKKVHVLAELPHSQEPFHLEEVDVNFRKAVTTARNRFERYLHRYHDRHQDLSRKPRKYWLDKVFSRFRRPSVEESA